MGPVVEGMECKNGEFGDGKGGGVSLSESREGSDEGGKGKRTKRTDFFW